jgi:DNA-binding response OmpR family regulator
MEQSKAVTTIVVFAEVNLPGPSQGLALAKEVRQNNPEIDVILTTGLVDAAAKASDLCEEGPINKPYHPKEILARIELLLERRRQAEKKGE